MSSSTRQEGLARAARQWTDLCQEVDALCRETDPSEVPEEAVQKLMTSLIGLYAAKLEAGADFPPFQQGDELAPTQVAIVASELLKAGDMELFELALWRIWGRT